MDIKLNALGSFAVDHKTESIALTVTDAVRRNKVKAPPMIINFIDNNFNEVVMKNGNRIGCNLKYQFDEGFESFNEFERNKIYLKIIDQTFDMINKKYPLKSLSELKLVLKEVEEIMDHFNELKK